MQRRWSELIEGRTEIEVLVEADLATLKTDQKIVEAIEAFRSGKVIVTPGGGGKYGEVRLPESDDGKAEPKGGQKSLFDF